MVRQFRKFRSRSGWPDWAISTGVLADVQMPTDPFHAVQFRELLKSAASEAGGIAGGNIQIGLDVPHISGKI